MKYDDASWHYGGDFPPDLPPEAGATHSAMFVAWALLNGLGGSLWEEEGPEEVEALRDRLVTPGEFLIRSCDEKFTDQDLSDEGNAFAAAYFDLETGRYLGDYEDLLARGLPSTYHVPDSWDSFDRLSPVIAARYEQWREGRLGDRLPADLLPDRPWWKLW